MFIEHKEYLALLDQVDYLKEQNTQLKRQNTILSQQLIKQREERYAAQQKHLQNTHRIDELHVKTILNQKDNTTQILHHMHELDQENKSFINEKFVALEKSSYAQLKDLEVKNVKTRIDYYQLHEFATKLRKIYKQTQKITNQNKKQPSLGEMLKWIKTLPGVIVEKPIYSPSASYLKKQSMAMSNKKKPSKKKLDHSATSSMLKTSTTWQKQSKPNSILKEQNI